MNEFKGTPGRWIKRGDGIVAPGNIEVAVVVNFQDDEAMDADATLIAAAPELLEALQLLMAEQTGGNKSCGHNGFTCMCSYNKARAAISKALVESQ